MSALVGVEAGNGTCNARLFAKKLICRETKKVQPYVILRYGCTVLQDSQFDQNVRWAVKAGDK